jgi:hypothetical protein
VQIDHYVYVLAYRVSHRSHQFCRTPQILSPVEHTRRRDGKDLESAEAGRDAVLGEPGEVID